MSEIEPARATNLPYSPIRFGTCAWSFDDWRGVFYP
jgi:hypothetical protein